MKARYPALLGTLLFLLMCMPSAQAAAYYVSPTGNALWSQCTNIITPCNATTAMSNAVAGDTVYFRGGTYDVGQSVYPYAVLYPKHSGTPGNPITFMAYPRETPVINGHVQIKVTGIAGAGTNNSMLVDPTKDFTALGIAVNDNVRMVGKDGGAWVASVADSHTIILVPSGSSHNAFYYASNCPACLNFVPGDAYDIGKDSTVVLGNQNHNYTVFDGFTIQANDGLELAGISIHGVLGADFPRSMGNVVRNITIIGGSRKITNGDNRDGLRIEDTNDTLVQNCKIYGIQQVRNGYNTAAIKLYHNTNATIENCEIFNSTVGIFDKSTGLNNTFRYNYIHNCYLAFYFYNFAWDGPPPFRSDHRNIKVYNNVVAYTTGGAFNDIIEEWSDSDNMEVFNNIFYSGYVRSVSSGFGAGGKKIYNNIWFGVPTDYDVCHTRIYNNGSLAWNATNGSFDPRGTREGLKESDYNDYYNVSGKLCLSSRELNASGSVITSRYYSLPAWQNSHELQDGNNPDLHSISLNPKFLNPSGTMSQLDDFRLASDSPCRGTGKNGMDMGANIDLVGLNSVPPQTCSELGGSCCSTGQVCPGSYLSSSDCLLCCTGGTCHTPFCGDTTCQPYSENCQSCPVDCLPGGQVCCSGTAYPGTCCSDTECPSSLACMNHSCSTGLVAHWEFDEGSGTTVFDSSGGGNTGTLVNGPTWTAGNSGSAVSFDGVNDRVNISDNDSLEGMSAITISAWIKPTLMGSDNYQRIVDKVWDSSYAFYIANNGSIGAGMGTAGSGSGYSDWSGGQFGKAVTANVWQHVAFVWDSATAQANVYLNGVAGTAQARDGDRVGTNAIPLSIGDRTSSDRSFSGVIDDVRIYNRALNASEILSLYQSGGCLHKSDNNPCDSCVDLSELFAFLDRWKMNNLDVTLKEIIEAIGLWKRGCS